MDKTAENKTLENKTDVNQTEEKKTDVNQTEENKAEENKAEENKAEENKAEDRRTEDVGTGDCKLHPTDRGIFIALEGIDGSGKSTQAGLLIERLRREGISCYATMEPTDSPIGSLIHQILIGRIKTDNKVIAGLFVADRLDHLLNEVNGIAAKIKEGTTVVTDRYYFSSYAYNSVDMPMDWVIQANEQSAAILRPTVTVFIDVDPDTALERIARNRFHQELFEKKSRLVKVREKYLEAFERLKGVENVVIIDGKQDSAAIADNIWEVLRGYF